MPERQIQQLMQLNLLFFCYADVTDDAEDGNLQGPLLKNGWPQAVNVGNAFLFGCFAFLQDAFREEGRGLLELYASAGLAMTVGQYIDLSNSLPNLVSKEDYFASLTGKSGASIRAFAVAPALLAKQAEPVLEALSRFGEELGIVSQVVSDVRELLSDSVGPDLRNRRLTLPLLCVLETLEPEERALFLREVEEAQENGTASLRVRLEQPLIRMKVEMNIELHRRRARESLAASSLPRSLSEALAQLLELPAFTRYVPVI